MFCDLSDGGGRSGNGDHKKMGGEGFLSRGSSRWDSSLSVCSDMSSHVARLERQRSASPAQCGVNVITLNYNVTQSASGSQCVHPNPPVPTVMSSLFPSRKQPDGIGLGQIKKRKALYATPRGMGNHLSWESSYNPSSGEHQIIICHVK